MLIYTQVYIYCVKEVKEMQKHEIESMASNLYDGGWRSTDKEELIASYKLTEEEAEKLVAQLAEYEQRAANWYIILQVRDKYGEVTREDAIAYADTEKKPLRKQKNTGKIHVRQIGKSVTL
jgi:hypothetical protein